MLVNRWILDMAKMMEKEETKKKKGESEYKNNKQQTEHFDFGDCVYRSLFIS